MEETVADQRRDASRSLFTWKNLRDIAVIALIAVVAWKLLRAEWSVNIDRFSFTDLLALILALFSVWLSVMFYFKADEGSNRFYANSYKFTSEISVILGRIEAGFGERLRHLDEGYSGMRDAFGHLTANAVRVDKNEEVLAEKTAEQQALLDELVSRVALDDTEKRQLRDRLARLADELDQARYEVAKIKSSPTREPSGADRVDVSPTDVMRFLAHQVVGSAEHSVDWNSMPMGRVREVFKQYCANLGEELVSVLRAAGYVSTMGRGPTQRGADAFKTFLIQASSRS